MALSRVDYVLDRGADWSPPGIVWKDSAGNPRLLTGYSAHLQVRDAARAVVLLDLSTAQGTITLGGAAGTITWDASATSTAALTAPQHCVYDLKLTAPDGKVTYVLEGVLSVRHTVTP